MTDPIRAALSQPEPEGPTDEELYELWEADGQGDFQECRSFARAVLTRWGRQVPIESKFNIKWALDALERLRDASMRYRLGVFSQEELQLYEDRAQKVIEAWSRGDEHEMSGSDATPQPAPPAEGEVGDEARYLAKELRDQADDMSPALELFGLMHRAADLLAQRYPQPVPVSERLPGHIEQALIKAECALADIAEGEAEESDGDPLEWAEKRAADALARIRPVMRQHQIQTSEWPPVPAHALPLPEEVEG